jgi:integrase
MTLFQLFKTRYLPHARRTLKPRTVAEYERLAEKVILPVIGKIPPVIGKIPPALGALELAGLTLDRVEEWHAAIPGAVQANRALAVLSAALSYALGRGLLTSNPCRGASRNREQGREFFYLPAQTRAILAAAAAWPDIRGRYLALTLLTGCRPDELLECTPAWRTAGAVRLPDAKTGSRTVFLSPAAEAILDGLLPGPEGRYFPAGMDLRRAWVGIARAAGVPVARRYDLRHTFASAALAAGTGLDVVGLMLGHRKRETTLRYAHLAPDVGVRAAAAAASRMGA